MFWFYWFPINGEIFILGRLKLLYDFRYIGSICMVTVLFHSNTMVARSANTIVVGCPSSPSAAPFHGTHPHHERCCGVDCDGCHEFYSRVKKPSKQQPATRPATRACGGVEHHGYYHVRSCEVRRVPTPSLKDYIMRVGRLRHTFVSPCKGNFRIHRF